MTTDASTEINPREFHGFLVGALNRVHSLELARYEEKGADLGELLTAVTAVLHVSIEILSLVVDYYEAHAEGKTADRAQQGSRGLCSEVERRLEKLKGAQDIADLAYIARMGLKARLATVEGISSDEPLWDIISETNSAAREVNKSLSAIERAVCEYEDIQSDLSYYQSELSRSVETRATYIGYLKDVVGEAEPTTDDIVRRLRLAGVGIAKITGRDIYPNLRVSDRIQFRALQERIMDWLRQANQGGSSHLREGLRLWQDTEAFAQLLRQVNNRAELRAHDFEMITEAIAACEAATAANQNFLDDKAVARVAAVEGLDPELDKLINSSRAPGIGEWRAHFDRLHAFLLTVVAPDTSSAPAGGEGAEGFLDLEGDFF